MCVCGCACVRACVRACVCVRVCVRWGGVGVPVWYWMVIRVPFSRYQEGDFSAPPKRVAEVIGW